MVVTLAPCGIGSGVWQERTATPSTCTVQAPQAATPQPYLVPVRFSPSRSAQSSGISPRQVEGAAFAVDGQGDGHGNLSQFTDILSMKCQPVN